jgi:hypothetical protein
MCHEDENIQKFYCPTPHQLNDGTHAYRCIPATQLCNHVPDCPGAEDEDLFACMFYEAVIITVLIQNTLIMLQIISKVARLHSVVAQLVYRSPQPQRTDLIAMLRR